MQPPWAAVCLHTIASTITSCSRDDMARTARPAVITPFRLSVMELSRSHPAAGGVGLWLCSIQMIYKQTNNFYVL